MNRLSVVLLLALMASGLYLVKVSYEARHLFVEIERAKTEEQQLQADERRLDAERRTAATHLRVERVARERLTMRLPSPDATIYVSAPAGSAASGVKP
jgi:cell division protein FtsL